METSTGRSQEPQRRPMRVGLYTDADELGGAERSMLHLVTHVGPEHDLVVCTTSRRVLDETARLVPHAERMLVHTRSATFDAVVDHRRALQALHLDLLQVTLGNPFRARPAMLAAFTLGVPTIAVEQLVLPARRRRGRLLKRALSRPLAAHVAVGDRSADDLNRWYGIPRRVITVIHNGIPDNPVDALAFDRRPVVGCAARLEEQKALDVLLRSIVALPDVRLVLVGDGSRRAALQRQAAELGVADRLELTGWLPDARGAISGFDIFALPSRAESFPLTIVEAMLSGTPVVASDVGSVREAIVHGETGLLVPSGDAEALSAAIRRLLDDRGLRERIEHQARALAASRFTATAMTKAYERLWSDVMSRRPVGP